MDSYIEQFLLYFSICGSIRFAQNMARQVFCDLELAQQLVASFDLFEVKKAAYFHGDIGESKNTLDELAANEQKLVHQADQVTIAELKTLGSQYLKKFGVKFLVSAKDKSASQLLQILEIRIQNPPEQELQNAKEALWEISLKRLKDHVPKQLSEIQALLKKHRVVGAQIALSSLMYKSQSLNFGYADKLEKSSISSHTYFELASLSKSVASCFAIEFFKEKNISLNTSVNSLFKKTKSQFRIQSLDTSHPEWADQVKIQHLMEHTALNMHYVNGIPLNQQMPSLVELLSQNNQFGYAEVGVTREPGKEFRYSGGGFLVLEHLIESLSNQRIKQLTDAFFKKLEITDLNFDQKLKHEHCAVGYAADGTEIVDTRKMFPAFAAGCMGTSSGVMKFLTQLSKAYNEVSKTNPISHSTARKMLFGQDKSSSAFMGAAMGLGVFTIEAGQNRFALHQGANDGFRALFLYCFSGPDSGKGFTIFCNSDQNAVVFICEVAQLLIRHLNFSGVNFALFESQFANTSVPAEEQVNQAYKTMIFNAFEPVLPEKIEGRTRVNKLLSLSLALDAEIVAVSNQRFARAENLFSKYEPVFDPELYGNQGKIMDSWESVRHNQLPADFIVFDLKQAAVIKYVLISTQFHLGNQAPSVQIEAYDEVSKTWVEILEETKLEGHALKCLKLKSKAVQFRRFKVSQFPDGGLTRLGLFSDLPEGEKSNFKDSNLASSQIYSDEIPKPHKPLTPSYEVSEELVKKNFERLNANEEFNISNLAYGAKIVSASNEHYSPAVQIISPYSPLNMFDGFESARSRHKNHFEEAVFSFFKPCRIHRYEIDFTFFKNNNPFEMSIEGLVNDRWMTILEPTNMKAFAGSVFDGELVSQEYFQQIRLKIIPDGGVNRVRFFTRKSALIEVAIL